MTSLSNILSIFANWLVVLNQVWTTFSTKLIDYIPPSASSGSTILLLQLTGLANFSILEVLIGGGLFTYILYKVIRFVLTHGD